MATINTNYNQFYNGAEQIKNYGSASGKKDTVAHYQFNTVDDEGNKVMDKMSKEESFHAMNEISAQYGDGVIVEFSGDGLTAFEEYKGKIPLQEDHREIPEDMMIQLEGPEPLTEEQLAKMNEKHGDDTETLMNVYDPKAYEEMKKIEKEGLATGTKEGMAAGFRYMWKWMSDKAKTDPGWIDKAKNGQQAVKNDHIMTDYSHELASRMPSIYGEKDADGEYSLRKFFSVSDTANNLLKAYASLYDEIVKGHEAGTRETYVEDKTAEGGYRKLTMEEELNELDKAYKDYADRYASNRDKHIMDILSAHAKKVSEISGGRTSIANKAKALLEKYKNDPVPEDFSSRMLKAANTFVQQYKVNRGMDINSLLSGISIFAKN